MGILRRILQAIEEIIEDIRGFFAGNGGLRITVLDGPTDLTNCGAARWRVRWSLRDMTKSGWIIQHVRFESSVTDCAGNHKASNTPNGLEYWEGWEVSGGKIWVGFAAGGNEHNADTFQTVDEGPNTKGTNAIRGKVRFIENFNLATPPWGYTVPAAGALPTITPPAEPDGWSDVGADSHDLVITWVCCDGAENQDTSTSLGPSLIQRILDAIRKLLRKPRGGEAPPPRPEPVSLPENVANLVQAIDGVPAWSMLAADDRDGRQQVVSTFREVAANDADLLRSAVDGYVRVKQASETGYDVEAMSRLYVLNRVLFNVPNRVELGAPRFGAFADIPYGDDWVDELWPLSADDQGNLQLSGRFGGYFGESYLAVQEFDEFARTYGRRGAQGGTAS